MTLPESQVRRMRCTAVEGRRPSMIVTAEVATEWLDSMVSGEVPYSERLAQMLRGIVAERI